jgi:hypothetical protein
MTVRVRVRGMLTHLVCDGETGLFLLQLLTARLILQHGPYSFLHPGTKQFYYERFISIHKYDIVEKFDIDIHLGYKYIA